MRLPGSGRLRRVVRSISNVFVPRTIILLYHRVTDLSPDPQLLCVSPRHFAEHLDILRKYGRPDQLGTLTQRRRRRLAGPCQIVVTFDDGYADNLYQAKPLLERYNVPATVFVATGYIGSRREFWQDELAKVFLQPGTLPEVLHLSVKGNSSEWKLGGSAVYGADEYESNRSWNVTRKDNPTLRQQLYRVLSEMLEALPDNQAQKTLEELLLWAGIEISARPTHRALLPDEVIRLADGGLVEVASHTVSHPVLSSLPVAAQKDEIVKSKAHLEEIIGQAVKSFAYPYGRRSDYTADTIKALREAGYHCACSNFAGNVRPNTDLWQLPRFLVRDWNGDEFAQQLRYWLRDY